jgi:hypothetical protein
MLHNGVSSKAPYFEDAKRTDIRLYGSAFVWLPKGSAESWLLPPEWIAKVTNKKTGEVHFVVNQQGCINSRIINLPADQVTVYGREACPRSEQ